MRDEGKSVPSQTSRMVLVGEDSGRPQREDLKHEGKGDQAGGDWW